MRAGSAGTFGCWRRSPGLRESRATIVAKLSSARIMSAASRVTSVPVMPIAMPMSADFSAGASLTPSPVIATMCPSACSAFTMRSLCSGATRAYTETLPTAERRPSSSSPSISLPLRASRSGSCQPEIGGDPRGCAWVVARDHHDANACGSRFGDRLTRLVSWRVDDPDQSEVHQLAARSTRLRRRLADGESAGTQPRVCAMPGRPIRRQSTEFRCRRAGVSGRTSPATRSCGASTEQHVRGALGDDGDGRVLVRVRLNRGHQLAFRGERHLPDPLEPFPSDVRRTNFGLSYEESRLGGIAFDRPAVSPSTSTASLAKLPPTSTKLISSSNTASSDRSSIQLQLALRKVTRAGDVDVAGPGHDLHDRHLVLGQRAGLV